MNENNKPTIVETGVDLHQKTVIGQTASPLKDILMDSIKKVQNDPSYIPQAKAIRENVRELVNLARVEIDAFREVRKVKI